MKNKSLILLTLAIGILAEGCKPSNPPGNSSTMSNTNSTSAATVWAGTKEGATNAWTKTKTAATNAWVDVKQSLGLTADYPYARKDEFAAKAGADLNALDQKIKELSDRAANVNESAKDDAQVKLQDIHNQRDMLDQRLDNVKNATETDWNDAKTAFQKSYEDATNSLQQTWQWLSDKVSS